MKTYKQKIGLSIAALALSIAGSFTYFSEKNINAKYPDIIAITLPFEKIEITTTADFLSDKKINNYSGVIPVDVQEKMNRIDFNPDEIEKGIITAKVNTESVKILGEMVQNKQITLGDLYEDIAPVFGEAVKNNEINWKWDGYAMKYTFFVAEGDELFWHSYFSHPSQTMFFHEVFEDIAFVKKKREQINVSTMELHRSPENIEQNVEQNFDFKEANKTEKFTYLAQKTGNFYSDKITKFFENNTSKHFEENNLTLQISSSVMGDVNIDTNIHLQHDYDADKKSLTVNLDAKGFAEDLEGEINITKIKNDIFAILNTYEYTGNLLFQKMGAIGVGEFYPNNSLENIKNQWYQLNDPEVSEIIAMLLNDKIQADVLNIVKDVAILAKDLITTTDIFIVNEYLGKNSETGFEEFSVKFNEKYTPYLEIIFSESEFQDIKNIVIDNDFVLSFDKNNAEYFEIEVVDFSKVDNNPLLKILYTSSGIDFYSRNFNYDDNDVYHFHFDKNNVFVEYLEKNKSDRIVDIEFSENNISGFWKEDVEDKNNIANFNFEKSENMWSGEITSDLPGIEMGKISIENFQFDKNVFSGIVKVLQDDIEFVTLKIISETSYPESLEIIDPSENQKNTIKPFEDLINDFTKEPEEIIVNTETNINTKNYTGSFYKGNYIWGGAMNLAWTDLSENIIQEEIDLVLDSSETEAKKILEKLNNPVMTKSDLSQKNYYIKSGYGQKTVDQINKETKEKFPTKRFANLNFELSPTDIIAYAYFLKEIEYKIPFSVSKYDFFFSDFTTAVKSFYAETEEQKENIQILHYENDEKFIVSLQLKDKTDNLILAKGYNMDSPEEVVTEIQKIYKNLSNTSGNIETLQDEDSFQMPFLHVDMTRKYTELIHKYFKNSEFTDYFIATMFENIKFDINEKGARVENEAVIMMKNLSAMPYFENQDIPKNIILDDDFWVIMKQSNSLNPYFILGIQNDELMTEFE